MRKYFITYGLPVGVLLLLLALVTYSVNAFWDWKSLTMLGIGGALTISYFVIHFKQTIALLERRDTKYGTNALISVLAVLGIIVLVNFIVSKRNYRVDLTAGSIYSLSEQTKKILKNLNKDINVYPFYKAAEQERMKDLLLEYKQYSSHFKYDFVDPDKRPELAKKYNVTAYNTTVILCGDKQEKITAQEEQVVTNALIKVTREGRKTIYFSEGHGEHSIDSNERDGFGTIFSQIKEQNYEVKKAFLAREETFPKDCSVLVIPGPKNDLFPAELDSISAFINKGGAVFFMLDPDPSPGMNEFFDKWGMKVGNDVVIDASGVGRLFGAGPGMPLVNTFGSHPIVADFGGQACFFPYTRSITPKDVPGPGLTTDWLTKTTERSFGETELKDSKAEFNEGKDLKGPVTVAAIVTKSIPDTSSTSGDPKNEIKGKLAIFGDSDFATNMYAKMQANGNLFMNTLNWLADEGDLVSIRPKDPEDRRLDMTARQTKIMFYISVLGIPLLVIFSGISVYYRRRKL